MRTKSTKQVEVMAFEKLPTVSILIGASKVVYKRHDTFIAFAVAVLGWTWAWMQFLG